MGYPHLCFLYLSDILINLSSAASKLGFKCGSLTHEVRGVASPLGVRALLLLRCEQEVRSCIVCAVFSAHIHQVMVWMWTQPKGFRSSRVESFLYLQLCACESFSHPVMQASSQYGGVGIIVPIGYVYNPVP